MIDLDIVVKQLNSGRHLDVNIEELLRELEGKSARENPDLFVCVLMTLSRLVRDGVGTYDKEWVVAKIGEPDQRLTTTYDGLEAEVLEYHIGKGKLLGAVTFVEGLLYAFSTNSCSSAKQES